jgi:hypothetical protein
MVTMGRAEAPFSVPTRSNVNEVVVTGPARQSRLGDLAGRKCSSGKRR